MLLVADQSHLPRQHAAGHRVSIGFAVYFVSSQLRTEAEADLQPRSARGGQPGRTATRSAARHLHAHRTPHRRPARSSRRRSTSADPPDRRADRRVTTSSRSAPICFASPDGAAGVLARDQRLRTGRRRVEGLHASGRTDGVLGVSVPWLARAPGSSRHAHRRVPARRRARRGASRHSTGADIAFAVDGEVRASSLPRAGPIDAGARWTRRRTPAHRHRRHRYTALVQAAGAPKSVGAAATNVPHGDRPALATERMRTLCADRDRLWRIVAIVTVAAGHCVSYGVARTVTRPLAPHHRSHARRSRRPAT